MDFKSYIKHDDCFNEFKNIQDKTVDLVCVDLPYGQTACEWDCAIDLSKMWIDLKRICKEKCVYVFFCTTKFGNTLINSNPKWFRYDLVWEKSRALGFLSAKKLQLRKHEMIYVFSCNSSVNDVNIEHNLELRAYSKKVKEYINKPTKQIFKDMGNTNADHFFRHASSQWGMCTEPTYNKLIELYKINEMEGFIPYKNISITRLATTYNPQMTPGKPYKTTGKGVDVIYNSPQINKQNITGDRYPTSILKFNQPRKSVHPTQKPTDILEWLIKTYSNDNDIVLDFTMGSGSTIEACMITNRRYIGIEKDKDIYLVAKDRLDL